jgi:hypothetical protein
MRTLHAAFRKAENIRLAIVGAMAAADILLFSVLIKRASSKMLATLAMAF